MVITLNDLNIGIGTKNGLPEPLYGGMDIPDELAAKARTTKVQSKLSYPIVRGCLKLLSEHATEIKFVTNSGITDGKTSNRKGLSFKLSYSDAKCCVTTEDAENLKVLKLCGMPFGSNTINYNLAYGLGLFLLMNADKYHDFSESYKYTLTQKEDDQLFPNALVKLADEMMLVIENISNGTDPISLDAILTQRQIPTDLELSEHGTESFINALAGKEDFEEFLRAVNSQSSSYSANSNNSQYIGELKHKVIDSITRRKHTLITGPSATGKTLAIEEAALELNAPLFIIRGTEQLEDRDLVGSVSLSAEKSSSGMIATKSVFTYGPLAKAVATARDAVAIPVVLFIDEINRLQTRHQNILLSLLTLKKQNNCHSLYIPDISEELECPQGSLVILAARNIGSGYAGTNLSDQALIRRFHKKLSIDYLDLDSELILIKSRTCVSNSIAKVVAKVASDTRFQLSQLKAPLDTDSLIKWAEEIGEISKTKTILVDDAIAAAKDIIYDICLDRDDRGNFDQVQESILKDNILENWRNEFKDGDVA